MSTKKPQLRGPRLRAAVLDATMALITAHGIEHVRVGDVAAQAGVNESSIYRTWSTRSALLADAVLSCVDDHVHIPDTGCIRTDLEIFVRQLADFLQSPTGQALLRTTATAGSDTEVAEAHTQFWAARLHAVTEIVHRAQRAGAISTEIDPELVMLTLGGLVHLHATHLPAAIPADLPHQAVALILPGLLHDTLA
jgi:AcrR family transcriptional regulator